VGAVDGDNSEFGQPGPLAYKVDTLIVNRRIDEAPRPLPQVIELGSLREICRQLGITDHNTETVKTALHQNASAYITAKIRYRTKTGRDRWTEIGYTRYSVAFAGEILPDGSTADTVCIVINPAYRELLNQVEVRPLDYDYLVKLAPGPQRFYELLSFQIYGAIASGRPRAKMLYSDYCKYAPQTQYSDFDHMKKQMYPAVVFKAYQGAAVPTDRDIPDAARRARALVNSPGIEDAQAFHIRSVGRAIVLGQELVSTADSQDGHIILNGGPQADALDFVQVLCDWSLLFILSSANKQQIVLVGSQGIANAQPYHAQIDTPLLTAVAQR
jgi:hypothetical protein